MPELDAKRCILETIADCEALRVKLGLLEAYFKTHPNPATMGFARACLASVIRTLEVAKVFEASK